MGLFGKKTEGKATIVAIEGYTGFKGSGPNYPWEHVKFIVDAKPDGGEPFRVETTAKIYTAYGCPIAGDIVDCKCSGQKVDLVIDGDPRYDPRIQQGARKAANEALLNQPPGTPPVDPNA